MPSDKRQRQRENSRARQQAMVAAAQRRRRRTQMVVGGVAIVVIAAALFWASRGGDDDNNASSVTPTTPTTAKPLTGNADKCPPTDGTKKRYTVFEHAPVMCIDATKKYTADIKTDVGTITVELNAQAAPNTVNNFVFLARNRYYDGIVFHRVIPNFMDQTGDPQGTGMGDPGYKFDDEIPEGYTYSDGDVAMANSGPNTNGSQFFIVMGPQGQALPPKYSPFGRVTKGLNVVKKINKDGSGSGEPNKDHHMISVTITEE